LNYVSVVSRVVVEIMARVYKLVSCHHQISNTFHKKKRSKQITIKHNKFLYDINIATCSDLARPKHVAIFILYRVRINYRRILQTHIFTNTEQKYMMLVPFERGMFAVS